MYLEEALGYSQIATCNMLNCGNRFLATVYFHQYKVWIGFVMIVNINMDSSHIELLNLFSFQSVLGKFQEEKKFSLV